MRKLIAEYRFQIAFVISLALHFFAFMACPHFGGEQGNPNTYQTIDVNFEEGASFSASFVDKNEEDNSNQAALKEAVYKPPKDPPPPVDKTEADSAQNTASVKPKKASTPHKKPVGKQKKGTSKASGSATGLEVFSLEQATLLKKLPLPSYPPSARRKGLEGTVTARVLIGANGLIKDIKIVRHTGSQLFVRSVMSTIKRSWQGVFAPHKKAGLYIDGWVEVTIPFKLR